MGNPRYDATIQLRDLLVETPGYMPTEFGDRSYPSLGTAGVQRQGYVEKAFREAKTP